MVTNIIHHRALSTCGQNILWVFQHPASAERQAGVTDFLNRHRPRNENKQFFFLPRASIEECYPERDGWRRTHIEEEIMDGRRKRQLAKRVGNDITQQEFEVGMPEVFSALARCWDLAF
jgi:putative ATP-dependent endonuclease of OLD family